MNSQTILITGATNGIGLQTAKVLAGMGHDVLVHGRDACKGAAAVDALRAGGAKGEVRFMQADLASLTDVRRLAQEVGESVRRLDVLVNNAGCANFLRSVTVDGYERTFAVNHLAPFLLTNLLLDKIKHSAPARIVNVASAAHRHKHIDFDDLMSERRYTTMEVYGRSKLANILFTRSLAKRLAGSGVTANALHPGVVHTGIGQNNWFTRIIGQVVMRVLGVPVEEGAETSIYLATSAEVAGQSGLYYKKCKATALATTPAALTEEVAERLWQVSEKLVGLSTEGNHA